MKKRLIIALALFVMILSACGAVQGTTTATNSSVSQTSATTQATCSSLHEQQAQLQKAIDTASKELSSGSWRSPQGRTSEKHTHQTART